MDVTTGQAVVRLAADAAHEAWGPRLRAVYALGSLAHGGFAPDVSDIDVGVILQDPLDERDEKAAAEITARVKTSGAPMADRLSFFWGSQASLTQGGAFGRFPPLDRLDLLQHGLLVHGTDAREGLPVPTKRELVVEAARFISLVVTRLRVDSLLKDPLELLRRGQHDATKIVLFPVRFLYTGRTGEIGRNREAADHLASEYPGPAADLALAAMRWREQGLRDDADAVRLVTEGLQPLYRSCIREHATWMDTYGEVGLAEDLRRMEADLLPPA